MEEARREVIKAFKECLKELDKILHISQLMKWLDDKLNNMLK